MKMSESLIPSWVSGWGWRSRCFWPYASHYHDQNLYIPWQAPTRGTKAAAAANIERAEFKVVYLAARGGRSEAKPISRTERRRDTKTSAACRRQREHSKNVQRHIVAIYQSRDTLPSDAGYVISRSRQRPARREAAGWACYRCVSHLKTEANFNAVWCRMRMEKNIRISKWTENTTIHFKPEKVGFENGRENRRFFYRH